MDREICVLKGGRGSSSYSASGKGFDGAGGSGASDVEEIMLAGNTGWVNGNEVSVASTLARWEDGRRNLNHEEMLVIGDDGFPVAAYKGDRHSVAFEGEKTRGMTVTHVHPDKYGGTFSEADISNFNKFNQKEIRASAREGTYSLKATRNANWDGLNKAYAKAQPSLADKASKAVEKVAAKGGSKTAQRKAYVDVYHKWYSSNMGKYGYTYEFIPEKGYKVP